jgi:hypothetical protein
MKLFASANESIFGFALIVILIASANGCGKANPPAAQTAADQNSDLASGDHRPVYQPTAAAPPVESAPAPQTNSEPDLRELQRSVIRWTMVNHRAPKNFEDFAATAGVAIPPPPAGKKYVIDKTMHVHLVNL